MSNGPPTPQQQGTITDQQLSASDTMKQDLLIRVENAIKLNELEAERAKMLGQSLAMSQEQLEISQNLTTMAANELKTLMQKAGSLVEQAQAATALEEIYNKIAERQLEGAESQKEYSRIMNNILEMSKKKYDNEEDMTKELKKQYDALEALNAKQKDVKEFSRLANQEIGSMAKNFGVTSDLSGTTSGNMAKLAANLKTGLSADKLTMISKSLSQLSVGMLTSLIDAIGKLAVNIQKLGVEFQRTNALAIDFSSALLETYKNNFELGVSQDEVSKSFQAVQDNMTRFNLTNQKTYQSISDGILLFGRFGISAEKSSKSMDLLARQFKLNEEQAIEMYKEIAFAGKTVGISAKKMTDDFSKAYEKISAYGAGMEDVFYELAKQVKDTGVQMDKLLGISEKFDTFQSASTQVAKLNSVLGIGLSAVDMMYATADERIDMLIDGVNGAGIAFEDLGYYQQKFLAEAMGVSGPAEAMRLLSGEGDAYLDQLQANQESMAELRKEAAKLVPFFTRLGMVLTRVVLIFEPLIEYLVAAMDKFLEFSAATDGFFEKFIFGLMMAGPGLKALFVVLSDVALAFQTMYTSGSLVARIIQSIRFAVAGVTASIGAAIAFFVGIVIIIETIWDSFLDRLKTLEPYLQVIAAIAKGVAYAIGAIVAAVVFLTVGIKTLIAIGIIAFFIGLGTALYDLWETITLTKSPAFWELLSKWIPEGIAMMASAANLAKQAISSFGAVLLSVFNTAIKPFVSGFSAIAGILGFDMSDDSPTETTVGKPATPSIGPKTTNATLSAAATEIKTLVVAQLKETGIQETANELAKIAKTLTDIKMVNDVKVFMDGDQISGRVVEKLVV